MNYFNFSINFLSILSETLKNADKVKEIASRVDVLVISKFALEENKDFFEAFHSDIVEYENVLQRTSVEMLREVIDQIKQTKF